MPSPTAPRTPAECFATLIACLTQEVVAMGGGNRLSFLLIGLITERLRRIKQCFARIATRIREGNYAPRRFAPHRKPETPRPRPPSRLPQKFGWLLPLVPHSVGHRSQLEYLLRDPEMLALLAAAPATLRRPLRSLCWMLRVDPPEILALPKKPRPPPKPRPAKQPAQAAPERRPDPPDLPAWMRGMPSSIRIPLLRRTRGPPKPA